MSLRPFLRRWVCHVQTLLWIASARVSQTCRDGLHAFLTRSQLLIILDELSSNKRFIAGVWLIAVTPLVFWGYRFFDVEVRNYDWYYINWSFFMFQIKEEAAGIVAALGFFLVLPQKWAFRWFCIPLAIFCATEIFLMWGYDDWKDFHAAMPGWQVLTVVLTGIPALFFSADYLIYRKYHLRDGNTARIRGIIRTPGLTTEQRIVLLEQLINEQENYNARI